jgi:predicted nucleic acid-binding Zn ribbon protein
MERIGGEISRELARFAPGADVVEIVAAWPTAVGETIARHAWPARVGRDGTLHVATDSSVWAFELAQLAPSVLERLQEALGENAPGGLRFAPGRLPDPSAAPVDDSAPARLAPGARDRALALTLTAGIGDEELRRLVARAAAVSLARSASDR